jgi:2-haloacid dehalogenase
MKVSGREKRLLSWDSTTLVLGRREILNRLAVAGTMLLQFANPAAASPGAFKAVAFDAFSIFDPQPVFALAAKMYPERGVALGNLWRTRQFEYTWLRTISSQYTDFGQITHDALIFAAKALEIDLTVENETRLTQAYFKFKCWPEVPTALQSLKRAGIRLALLSNLTVQMLQASIENSHLNGVFDSVLSTDRVGAYKPHPRAYQMGLDSLRLKRHEVLFAPFAGWDTVGAKLFGYPTFWVNRQNQPPEELGVMPDGTGRDLSDLVSYVFN